MTPYRTRKGATPLSPNGQLLCDRCGCVVVGWALQRSDTCGGAVVCIRQRADVERSWARYGWTISYDSAGNTAIRRPR